MRVGIISDTHGLLRPEAVTALQGVNVIIHAGDVGRAEVLSDLKNIAPVFAVRGNVDTQPWAQDLSFTTVAEVGGASFYVVHILQELDLRPDSAKFDFVVSGHTHQAEQFERNGVLYLNPGSAGPCRFHYPVTLALLDLAKKPWQPQILELKVR
jgi:uncharacterized protein